MGEQKIEIRRKTQRDRAELGVDDRIRLFEHTEHEIDVARAAVPHILAAMGSEPTGQPGGSGRRYDGETALDVVESSVKGAKRQTHTLALALAMVHEEYG